MIIKAFETAFETARKRGWDRIAVAVDLHGTVLVPNYSHTLADEYYPGAKECLQYLSKRADVVMYMYSCTPPTLKAQYQTMFQSEGIHMYISTRKIDEIMDIKPSLYQNFNEKPYFNVLLEDKAGFDPEEDWLPLLEYLKNN